MGIDYGYLLRYQQLLLAEVDVLNQVLVLDKFDTVDFPDEVLEIVLDHVRLSKAGGRGSGDPTQEILDRVSLVELCRLYYVEKISIQKIPQRLGVCERTFYTLLDHYALPTRSDMRRTENKTRERWGTSKTSIWRHRKELSREDDLRPEGRFAVSKPRVRVLWPSGLLEPDGPQRSEFVTPRDLLSAWGDKSARMINKILSGEKRFCT